jgi:hypothetical protein
MADWRSALRGQHRQTLAEAKLAVAYLGTSTNQDDLKQVAEPLLPSESRSGEMKRCQSVESDSHPKITGSLSR